jgi:hypothetical protein
MLLSLSGLALTAINNDQLKSTLRTLLPLILVTLLSGIGHQSVQYSYTQLDGQKIPTQSGMNVTLMGAQLPFLLGMAWLYLPKLLVLGFALRSIDKQEARLHETPQTLNALTR